MTIRRELDIAQAQSKNDGQNGESHPVKSLQPETADQQCADPGADRAAEEAARHESRHGNAGGDPADMLGSAKSVRVDKRYSRADGRHQKAEHDDRSGFRHRREEDNHSRHHKTDGQQAGSARFTAEQGGWNLHEVASDAHAGEDDHSHAEIDSEILQRDRQKSRQEPAEHIRREMGGGENGDPGS